MSMLLLLFKQSIVEGGYFAKYRLTGSIHIPIIIAMDEAVINNDRPEINETNMADRNCPANMAIVHRLALIPFFSGALLLTTRLLNSGVESPKPRPINTTAIARIIFAGEIKYNIYARA